LKGEYHCSTLLRSPKVSCRYSKPRRLKAQGYHAPLSVIKTGSRAQKNVGYILEKNWYLDPFLYLKYRHKYFL
ncbi:MAG: hypothetical protein V5A68_06710, partial [Candidatus Thermoplasmatota archaeon]